MMEATAMNAHQHRLAEFGLSFKKDGPVTVQMQGEEFAQREQPGLAVPEAPEGRVHHMLRLLSFSFLLKAGAICSSVLLTLSPLRAVWKMQEANNTLTYPPFTFFCVAACGLQWCMYGSFAFLVTNNYGFLILVYSNILGVIMGTYYCYTYFIVCKDEYRLRQFYGCLYAAIANYGFEAVVIPALPHPRALLIVGTLSAFYSVLVSFAPIADFQKIVLKGDVSGMPQDVVMASFVASVLWFGCALLLHDTWILVPNFFGLVLGGFQLFLLAYFGGYAATLKNSVKSTLKVSYGTMDEPLVAEKSERPIIEEQTPPPVLYAGTGGTGDWD